MNGSQTAEVRTYSSSEKIGVLLPHPSSCKQAKLSVAKRLGLKPQSLPVFGLCMGPLGRPNKVLQNSDILPIGGDFSFQRFSFDLQKESKLSKQDDVAMHLLYCEARHHYQQEENCKLEPSPAQREELDIFIDPDFPVERQFMDLVRNVPGYDKYIVHECIVKETIRSNERVIPKGTDIECHLTLGKLSFVDRMNGQTLLEWNWKIIRRWKTDSGSGVSFEVCLNDLNASILKWVSLESRQSNYLFHLASGICDMIKQDRLTNPLPTMNQALAGTIQDPLGEFVNGLFKGFTPKFDSIQDQ